MNTNNQGIKTREELPPEMCWDLTPLYASEQDWEKDFEQLDLLLKDYQSFQGHLQDSPSTLKKAFESGDRLFMLLEQLYVYAHLKNDEDTGNAVNSGRYDRISAKHAEISGETAWFLPEIMEMKAETFDAMKQDPELSFYQRTFQEIERARKHILSRAEERILGMSAEIFDQSHSTFAKLNNADLTFPKIKNEAGQMVDLTHGNFIKFLQNPNREVRKAAFDNLYQVYGGLKHTFASLLGGTVKTASLHAKLRGHESARAAALHSDHIPLTVYDRLIDNVHAGLPAIHHYFALRAKKLNLDKIEMFDIHNPLFPSADIPVEWPQAVSLVKEAVKPLGDEYCRCLDKAFDERWIDVLECKGKRSGAYSSGTYRKNPYILMNFSGTLNCAFTLAHELGHSIHSYFSDHTQDFHYASYRIFVAEVASTTNELLLHHHLMNTAESQETKAYLLNHLIDEIRGTVFRQTMFAEFERDIHAMDEAGEPLTADSLSKHYWELNQLYHGDSVISNEAIQYEWARIPHFHYNFYVYKYATGMSAAAALAQDILAGKTDRYLNFLKAGGSRDVIDIMKDAGVDFTTDQPVQSMMQLFKDTVQELEKVLF